MKLHNTTVKNALQILEQTGLPFKENYSIEGISYANKISVAVEKEKVVMQVISVGEIVSPALLNYISDRKINLPIARKYLKEIRYKHPERLGEFYALAWETGDGFEASSPGYKEFIGAHKDISRIGLADGKFFLFLKASLISYRFCLNTISVNSKIQRLF